MYLYHIVALLAIFLCGTESREATVLGDGEAVETQELLDQMERLQLQLTTIHEQHTTFISETRDEQKSLQEEMTRNAKQNYALSNDVRALEVKNRVMSQQNKELEQFNDEIKQKLQELRTKFGGITTLGEECNELRVQTEVVKSELNDLRRELEEIQYSGVDKKIAQNTKFTRGGPTDVLDQRHGTRQLNMPLNAGHGDSNRDAAAEVIAFYVTIGGFTGSPDQHIAIPFDVVSFNLGDGYNTSTGEFLAPVTGVYSFSYEVLGGSICGTSHVCVHLYVNDVILSTSCAEENASGGTAVDLQLTAGDVVWIAIASGQPCETLIPGYPSYNKFSGHLVYEVV